MRVEIPRYAIVIVEKLISLRVWVLLLWAVVFAAALMIASQLQFDASFKSYFSKTDPRFQQNLSFESDYQTSQLIIVLQESRSWRQAPLQARLTEISQQLQQLPFVESLVSIQDLKDSQAAVLTYKKHPRESLLISEDEQKVLLKLTMTLESLQGSNSQQVLRHMEDIDAVFSAWKKQSSTLEVFYSGSHALNQQYAEVLKHDLRWFLPGLAFVLGMMLVATVRHRAWLVGIVVNSSLTLLLTIAFAVIFELKLAAISAAVPMIIGSLSIAYAVHLYFSWARFNQQLFSFHAAMKKSVEENIMPLLGGTMTTALGFSCLMFSPSPPIQGFGLMIAFAVVVNFVLNFSLLLVIASFQRVQKVRWQGLFPVLANLNGGRLNRYVFALMAGLTLLSAMSLSQLSVNDDPFGYFPENSSFSRSKAALNDGFFGVNQVMFELDTQKAMGVTRSQYIKFANKFRRYLLQQPQVIRVDSLPDWLKTSGASASQFRRLFREYSVPALGLTTEVNHNASASVVSVFLLPMDASELLSFEAQIQEWLKNNVDSSELKVSQALGYQMLFAHLSIENSQSMLASFGLTLLLSLLFVLWVTRCWKSTGLALLANALPLLWVFGIWYWLGRDISLGSAVVMGMIIGIIVDDTLHITLNAKPTTPDSLQQPLSFPSLPALTFTSMTLVMGLAVGFVSEFKPIFDLSLLSCMTLVLAWWFDVYVLTSLMRRYMGRES